MNRIRTAAVNSTLVMGSIVLSFVLFEVILCVSESLDDPRTEGHHALCCEYHPVLGWRHKSNTTIEIVRPEYRITETFNGRGVRGPEYPLKKPPGEYRIVVIGDSFAEGITVDFDQLFSEVMKRRLNINGGSEFQVINLGVAGYSTDQQLLLFRTEGKRYEPDLTVLMVYDNDIWFNSQMHYTMMRRGNKPLFRLVDGELELVTNPVPRATVTERYTRDAVSGLGRVKYFLNQYSHTYRWLRIRVRSAASVQSFLVSLGIMNASSVPVAYGIYRKHYSPETQHAWTMTRALITELKKEVESAGSRFVVLHAPFKATIHDEYWVQFKRNYGVTDAEWSSDRVNDELAGILAELGIEFLNPVEVLRMVANSELLYFDQDTHWNADGNRVVGTLMADHVLTLVDQIASESLTGQVGTRKTPTP